jgi:RNA polymerase sigma factor (sigma-70 family)
MEEFRLEDHIGWVIKLAAPWAHMKNEPVEDSEFYADGLLGLVKAKQNFDPNNGAQFLTYATYVIKSSMARGAALRRGRGRMEKEGRCRIRQPIESEFDNVQQKCESHTTEVLESIRQKEVMHKVSQAIAALPERLATVIRMRMQGVGLKEIGQHMGLSKQRIEQMEKQAHGMLRGMLLAEDSQTRIES